jgi:hypothetical protein
MDVEVVEVIVGNKAVEGHHIVVDVVPGYVEKGDKIDWVEVNYHYSLDAEEEDISVDYMEACPFEEKLENYDVVDDDEVAVEIEVGWIGNSC